MRIWLAVIFAMGLATAPIPARAQFARGGYFVMDTFNVPYGPFPLNVLDECVPVPKPGQWAGPFPAIVFVHGGAWTGGDKSYHKVDCNVWASFGFVGISIDYRLVAAADPTTWWPTQIVDAQAAVRWVRLHAATLHLNPDQIYALGDSAGGQLVEWLSFQPRTVPGDLAAINTGVQSHVQYAIAEFAPSHWGPSLMQPGAPDPRTYDLLETSHTNTSAVLLVQGTLDPLVTPGNSIDMYHLLALYHRPVTYIAYDGGHEFAGLTNNQISVISAREITLAMGQAKYFTAMPQNMAAPVIP